MKIVFKDGYFVNMNEWETWLTEWINQIPLKDSSHPLVISSDFSGMALKAASMRSKADPLALIRIVENKLPGITILVPAFKNSYLRGEWFDPQNTLPDTGSLARRALRDPSFIRTSDPLHSFLVKGPLAQSCILSEDESTFGKHSVFGWLYQYKAFQLLIDVDLQHSFTFAHYVEEQRKVHYRKYKNLIIPVKVAGDKMVNKKVKLYAKKPGYRLALNGLHTTLSNGGALWHGKIDGISWMLIDLSKSYQLIANDIENHQAKNLIIFDTWQFIRDIAKMLLNKV